MSTYYVGTIACDSNYLAHYGVPGMEWGAHKKKKDYALDEANIERRGEMQNQQNKWMDRNYNPGNATYERKTNAIGSSSVKVGGDAQRVHGSTINRNMSDQADALRAKGRMQQANAVENAMYNRVDQQNAGMNRSNRVTQESKRRNQIEQQIIKKRGRTKPMEFAAKFSRH